MDEDSLNVDKLSIKSFLLKKPQLTTVINLLSQLFVDAFMGLKVQTG